MIFFKKLSIILALAIIFSTFRIQVLLVNDVYAAPSASNVIDFSNQSVTGLASKSNSAGKISYSADKYYDYTSGSMKFEILTSSKNFETNRFSFSDNGIISDWSYVSDITFTIYNTAVGTDVLNIIFCKSADTIDNGYYRYTLPLDWKGWKKITVPCSDFRASKGITSWKQIDAVYFNMAGWSGKSTAGTCFYVSSVKGNYDYDLISSECLSNSLAIYDGECTAIYQNKNIELSNPPLYSSDVLYAPLDMFANLDEFSTSSGEVQSENITAAFEADSAYASVGAYTHNLCRPAFEQNGALYVPLCDICKIFDIPLMCDGRFAVICSADDISNINSYSNSGLNLLCEKIISKLTVANGGDASAVDCDMIIEKWLVEIVGNAETNSGSDSIITKKIKTIDSKANDSWSKLVKTEGATELFSDITTLASADMTSTSLHIYQMAQGYAAPGGALYKNKELLSDLLYAINWFYENRYGADEAQNNENAWRDRTLYNWWDWRIGTPQNWIPTLMMLRDEISDEDMTKYLTCFNASVPKPTSTGSNYISMVRLIIGASCLIGDNERIKQMMDDVLPIFDYVDDGRNPESKLDSERAKYTQNKGQGFYKDGSYVYHTLHAMNGSYGLSHLNMASDVVYLLYGTGFELPLYCVDNIADWIINSFDSLMYKNRFPRMVVGRNQNPSGLTQSRTIVKAAVRCFELFSESDKDLIGSIIKEYSSYDEENFISNTDINQIANIRAILSSDKFSSYNYETSNVFANMDKAMHKRENWAFALSMSSSRIFNYESINGLNKNGWYLGDGRYEIIIDDEGAKSAENYWKYIDYYRLPGTTVDTQVRQQVSIAQGNEYLSSKDFVGGATLDGKYLTAAMHLESYHNNSAQGNDNGSYGSSAPEHTNDLVAKKSYFAFDNEIYCLGSEINASNNNSANVLTVIDNRILTDEINSNIGSITLADSDASYDNITWLNADEKIGYYFPQSYDSVLSLRKKESTNTYFESVLNHGVNPEDASYAYVILPGLTSSQTSQYAKNPDVEILSNTTDVHAVKHNVLGITSIVFWNKGSFGGITVDKPMIVMLKEDKNNLKISVSDPTQKLQNAKITFDRAMLLDASDKRITQETMGEASVLNIDFSNSLGLSFEANLKHSAPFGLSLKLLDETGNKINKYSAHTHKKLTASVSSANLGDSPESIMLVIAMYSDDGTLQYVQSQTVAVSPANEGELASVTLTPDSETSKIRAFVWQNDTLTPFEYLE